MPSSSSGSSSESNSSAVPARKRRQVEAESSGSSEGRSSPDISSADEQDSDAPQPPPTESTALSHAERRRQKKRQKRDQLVAASPRKKRKLDDGTGASPPFNVESSIDVSANANAKAVTKTKAKPVTNDPGRQKRQNSVWVGNLSFRTTQDALRGFFDGVGTITRVHMPMRRGNQTQGENMGFAYVDFETPEAKVIAITLSEGQLDGRNLLIKDGGDFTGRPTKATTEPSEGAGEGEGKKAVANATMVAEKSLSKTAQKILRVQKQPPAPTLFLGNLGFETTEKSIRELFEAHRRWERGDKGKGIDVKAGERDQGAGENEGGAAKSRDVWIRKIRMGTFEDSGACKGFAFVDFTSIEHATEALVNPRNHRLNGRDLLVEYASPDAVRRGGGFRRGGDGSGTRNPKEDRNRESRAPQNHSANAPHAQQHRPRHTEQADSAGGTDAVEMPAETTPTTRRSGRPDRVNHDRVRGQRARPGAALAHAQRQSAAILPGQGQKIVF